MQLTLGWHSPTVSQDADWEVSYLPNGDDQAMSSSTPDGTVQDYAGSSATADGMVKTTFALPAEDFDDTDTCLNIRVMRDGNDDNDNLGDSAFLDGMCFRCVVTKLGGDF